MTGPNSASPAQRVVRAQTVPGQRFVNLVTRGLLRAPLLSRLVGKRLLTLYVVGRKSGRRYAIPVAYTRLHGSLLVGSQFAWIRNLRTGVSMHVRLAGRVRIADVRVLTDPADVVEHLAIMAKDNHQFAKLNKIGFDPTGEPIGDDLHLAWAAGARVAVLTPADG